MSSPVAAATASPENTETLQEKAQHAMQVMAEKASEAGTSLKEWMGIVPEKEANDGEGYTPSKFSTKMFVSKTTNYEKLEYENKYSGPLKLLVVCTEERYLTCTNNLKFSTGNHPAELFVPLLHLDKAGLTVDFCTPTGASVKTETWAMPTDDANVLFMQQKYKAKLEKPLNLKDVAAKLNKDSSLPYVGVFLPGGHGAMLGLPENDYLGGILEWMMDNDKYVISICHGPAALLANAEKFNGYSIACFPDKMDKFGTMIGYLPGQLPWFVGEKLAEKNIKVVNALANGTTHVDRKVLTGDSPSAANALGKLAAETILNELNPKKDEDADL